MPTVRLHSNKSCGGVGAHTHQTPEGVLGWGRYVTPLLQPFPALTARPRPREGGSRRSSSDEVSRVTAGVERRVRRAPVRGVPEWKIEDLRQTISLAESTLPTNLCGRGGVPLSREFLYKSTGGMCEITQCPFRLSFKFVHGITRHSLVLSSIRSMIA